MADNNEMLIQTLSDILKSETSPEMQQVKQQIMKRIAEESVVKPTRIPAPLNITEVGGYYNLIEQICKDDAQRRTEAQMSLICSALGLPV